MDKLATAAEGEKVKLPQPILSSRLYFSVPRNVPNFVRRIAGTLT